MMRSILLLCLIVVAYNTHINAQVLGNPIVTWDFANGIPANWQNASNSNIGLWEYRGPNTTPDITVGARGSCAAIAQPIASLTQSNGFVIFDSNYWDDIDMTCGGLGSGVDPAPHTAWLITNPINLSNTIGTVITWQQQYRNFSATMRVQISTNGGGNWTDILTVGGFESPQVEWRSVNISSQAAGQASVQFRFLFTGTYYWWLLDDITVYEPNQNDIGINNVRYTTNTGTNNTDLQYDQYPITMIPPFSFRSTCTNIGALTQTNVRLNTRVVRNGVTQTYNQTTTGITMAPGATNTFIHTPNYTNPATLGDYKIFYEILQNQVDDNLTNNKDSLDYTISQYTYARDEGPAVNFFQPNSSYQGFTYEAGNFFQARSNNRVCHSIGIGIGAGTQVGAQVKGVIYASDMETLLAETNVYTVNAADINQLGQEKIVNLPLITPLTLTNNTQYLVMMATLNGAQAVTLARSGSSIEESSILRYPEVNALFYFLATPVVRMNIFMPTDVPGCNDPAASNFQPSATINGGTCIYPGCSNPLADNYYPNANFDNGSCIVGGCTDPLAANYSSAATYNNGSCLYPGCTDPLANNFDPLANLNDNSCVYINALLSVQASSGCVPFTLQATNLTTLEEGGICNFTFGDGEILDVCEDMIQHTYTEPGEYSLSYTYSVGEFSSTYETTITVWPNPVTPILSYDPSISILQCIDCSSSNTSWLLDGVELSHTGTFLETNTGNFYENGYYAVLVQDENGCSSSSSEVLVLQPRFSLSEVSGCAPLSLVVTNQTDPVPGMLSTLNLGDGTSQDNFVSSLNHTYIAPGLKTVTLEVSFDGVSGSKSNTVQVFDVIIPNVSYNSASNQVQCSNCNSLAEVIWSINGQEFVGSGPFEAINGTYTVTGITTQGCEGTAQLIVSDITGIALNDLQVYPNPSNETLTVVSDAYNIERITLINQQGRVVVDVAGQFGAARVLDVKSLASGAYVLKMETTQGIALTKVQIVH